MSIRGSIAFLVVIAALTVVGVTPAVSQSQVPAVVKP